MPRAKTHHEYSDVFSFSDQVLADQLEFIDEVGFGNWGSVWACRPKLTNEPNSSHRDEFKIAVKLVHRTSKSHATTARIRSLWNEMKIIRSFRDYPHPSIIPFHSFITTPSYALITMTFLPTVIPVEVDEVIAKGWFRSLLSAMHHLHSHGVVHNDIKPSNILLSDANTPVIIDFGFAEQYDVRAPRAFHSSLSYGTPEYLAPERARGMSHDTRKADVWSLGITFFEILVGRTPFERGGGETFTTKEDLKRYWSRTVRGKWVGTWKMSKPVEKLLMRMMAPGVSARCTALGAMADPYWKPFAPQGRTNNQLKTASCIRNKDKENVAKGHVQFKLSSKEAKRHDGPKKGRKQKTQTNTAPVPPTKKAPSNQLSTKLSASKGVVDLAQKSYQRTSRKPLAPMLPTGQQIVSPSGKGKAKHWHGKALVNVDHVSESEKENVPCAQQKEDRKSQCHVKRRMWEWERERERLRELEKIQEREREHEQDEIRSESYRQSIKLDDDLEPPRGNVGPLSTIYSAPHSAASNSSRALQGPQNAATENPSTDRAIPTNPRIIGWISPSQSALDDRTESRRNSWEDTQVKQLNPLVPLRPAVHGSVGAVDDTSDRIAMWVRNVEKVVEEARQSFASISRTITPSPLPPAPIPGRFSQTRTTRASHMPHKTLETDLSDYNDQAMASPRSSNDTTHSAPAYLDSAPIQGASGVLNDPREAVREYESRARVAVGSSQSLDLKESVDVEFQTGQKERSKSEDNLLGKRIVPVAQLELELAKEPTQPRKPQLSILLNRPPVKFDDDVHTLALTTHSSLDPDDFTSSPVVVQPYPTKTYKEYPPGLDRSTQRRIEGMYDRVLAATFGVKRVGQGYQFDNADSAVRDVNHSPTRLPRFFHAARRAIPLRVSYLEKRPSIPASDAIFKDPVHGHMHTNKATFVRRAIGTIMWNRAFRRRQTTRHSCL